MLERRKMTEREIKHWKDALYNLDESQERDITQYHRGEITTYWEIQHNIDYLSSCGWSAEEILENLQKDIGFNVLWIVERECLDYDS